MELAPADSTSFASSGLAHWTTRSHGLRRGLHPLPLRGWLRLIKELLSYPALMRAGDAHIFAILGYRTARYLDALRLQDAS
jgi:hypothetical protein